MNHDQVISAFRNEVPVVDHWSLRLVSERHEVLTVRQGVLLPPRHSVSQGAHITLIKGQGFAYAATSRLTREGFRECLVQANKCLQSSARWGLVPVQQLFRPKKSGAYKTDVVEPWESVPLAEKIAWLQRINESLNLGNSIVDYTAKLCRSEVNSLILSSENVQIEQSFQYLYPGYQAVANEGAVTQIRSGGGWGTARQGGLELLQQFDFPASAQHVAEEAQALLRAPECPSGVMSALLMPSQMMLQIHESIGHPLELDRILGDERNYAGTSFVTPDMFGSYQYGSELLHVTFDPTVESELATYAYDDDGDLATRQYLIKAGVLQRPLGSAVSQMRAGMQGVANARAGGWNRPAIDRMANLNLEPGLNSFEQLCAHVEHGVLMDSNCSWSIDDSRNKFQFGCELGRVIQDGELKGMVRNPNYRGVSAKFWRNLAAVGSQDLMEIWGTPNCGKGEPNQLIQVGHASPPCVFHNVDVFGGG
ncbi:MAG: TldD/PmbA family protein [Gammaproteobacteria bacterium]|nr:TldD/PmbA family protein [Gammaproteobacteria bacterium]MDH5800045.1 TldD/PmbA family protein [Gammaproteobacteria bacterium]